MTALANLNVQISAEASSFMRDMEGARSSLKRMADSLYPLEAAEARLARQLKLVDDEFKRGQITQERAADMVQRLQARFDQFKQSQSGVASATNATRAGMQQFGFQMQDLTVQIAGGTTAIRAFSVQAPQMIGALQLMAQEGQLANTRFAALAGALSGPLGIGLATAIPLLSVVAQKFMETSKAAEDARKSSLEFGQGLLNIEQFADKTTGKMIKLAEATQRAALAMNRIRQDQLAGQAQGLEKQGFQLASQFNSQKGQAFRPAGAPGTMDFHRQVRYDPDVSAAIRNANGNLFVLERGIAAAAQRRPELRGLAADISLIAAQSIEAGKSFKSLRDNADFLTGRRSTLPGFSPTQDLGDFSRALGVTGPANDNILTQKQLEADQVYIQHLIGLRRDGGEITNEMLNKEAEALDRIKKYRTDALQSPLDATSMFRDSLDQKNLAYIIPDKEIWEQLKTRLKDLGDISGEQAKQFDLSWTKAAHNALGAMNELAQGLQGNVLQAISGVLDLVLQLGNLGLFGSKFSAASKSVTGYSAGGFTGGGSSLDVAGVVHRREFVFDAAATSRIGVDNLERLRRGGLARPAMPSTARLDSALAGAERVTRVVVDASPLLLATTDQRASEISAAHSVRAAGGGAAIAERRMGQRARQRIPSRRG